MPLIDDEGNLFGVVNVIDALAVVLLLAVVVAGIAIVTSGGDRGGPGEPEETRYAPIELGQQPDYVINRLEVGDVATVSETGATLTVTDVYVTPSPMDEPGNETAELENETVATATEVDNETTSAVDAATTETPGATEHHVQPFVTIKVAAEGEPLEDDPEGEAFFVNDEPLLLGHDLELNMGSYVTNGTITDLGEESALAIEETSTIAEVELHDVSPAVAAELEEGMEETVRGETHARILELEREPAAVIVESADGEIHEREHPRNEDITLTVELRTQEATNGVRFRGEPLQIGGPIVLDFDTLIVEGEVTDIESSD